MLNFLPQRAARRRTRRPTLLRVEELEARTVPTVNIVTAFPGMSYGTAPGSVPPDTIAAAGPTEIVETVNTSIAIFNKSGSAILAPTPLHTFFQSVGPTNFLSDSDVAYDELTGKFFVGDLSISFGRFGNVSADSFMYAVSKTSSPASASDFQFFSVNLTARDPAGSGSFWGDYPRIGWNANEFVATFNMFTTDFAENYDHPLVLNINASDPSATTLVDMPGGGGNATLAPATMHGSVASDPMYFVEETIDPFGNTGNSIRIVTETNPFTFPSFGQTDVVLPAADDYDIPPNATQKGTSNLIQTNDSRILNAEWRAGHLVAAQAVGVASDVQSHARWYEFDTTSTPQLLQAGTIGVGSGFNSYFPSIAIGANDVLGLDYMESSPNEFMSVWVTGRLSSDPTGQMEAPKLAQAGQATYHGFDSAPYRAGDFSGLTVDPTDGSFWAANEYATSATTLAANWGTAIVDFQVVSSVLPPTINSISANPNPVTGTTTVLSVTASDPNPGASITKYTWSVQQGPSGVTFDSNNGTINGNIVTAAFSQSGSYTFQVTVTDSLNASNTATVAVTVQQTLTSITLSPATATVADGNTQQFAASAFDQFGRALATSPSFTWSLAAGGAGTINSTGLYTAPSTGSGTDTVQASVGTVTGTAKVTYTQPSITSISANPNPVTGTTTVLSVTATDPNATITKYTWSVQQGPSGVAFDSNNGTINGNSVTATFTQYGSYTFEVTVADSLGASNTATVIVTVQQTVTTITVSPATAIVADGATQQFTAIALDQFGSALATSPSFTWSVAVGGTGTIDSSTGLYTAPSTGSGTDTVQASVATVTGMAVVTFAQPSVVTQPASAQLSSQGTTASLSVTATDPNPGGTISSYTWSVSGPSGVTFSSNNGTSTGDNSTATFTQIGDYTFTVTITDSFNLSATSSVELDVGQVVTTVTVSPATATVPDGTTQQFTASAADQFGNSLSTSPSFAWSVAVGGAGTIDSGTGLYTAPSTGSDTDTVQATVGTVTATAVVTYVQSGQPPIVTQPASAQLSSQGTTASLSVTATDPNPGGAISSYTWSVSGPSGVTFSSNNGTSTGDNATATFTQIGDYTFTVTIIDSFNLSTTSSVELDVGQVVTTITVSPATATVPDGTTQQFTAGAFDQFVNALSTSPSFTWSVATGGAGTVDSTTGLYTAPSTSSGTDTVQASVGTVTGTAAVTYVQPPIVTQPASALLSSQGTTASLSVTATDPNPGGTITSYTWSVSGPSGVTFSSNNGTSTGNNATATFTQIGDYTFTVTITDSFGLSTTSTAQLVVGQVLTSMTVSPSSVTLHNSQSKQFTAAAFDQFNNYMTVPISWSIVSGLKTGSGTLSSTGLYTAPSNGNGTVIIEAFSGNVFATVTITVKKKH